MGVFTGGVPCQQEKRTAARGQRSGPIWPDQAGLGDADQLAAARYIAQFQARDRDTGEATANDRKRNYEGAEMWRKRTNAKGRVIRAPFALAGFAARHSTEAIRLARADAVGLEIWRNELANATPLE